MELVSFVLVLFHIFKTIILKISFIRNQNSLCSIKPNKVTNFPRAEERAEEVEA